jgi:hypothetical protein
MALTFTQMQVKFQRLSRNSNSDVLTQAQEDMNTGYHMFNAKLSRYYSRKQQFASLVANQGIYQQPVDAVRVSVVSILVTSTYEVPLKEIRSEQEWRYITSYKTLASNWPEYYMVLGNDKISIWPLPSQAVANGLRYVYQPQAPDLTQSDTTSVAAGATATVTNGSTTVTASGVAFNADMATLSFHTTGQTDTTWYEIFAATSTTLTLKTPYAGTSGSGKAWTIGQLSIIPQEYQDSPIYWALFMYFMAQGNDIKGLQYKQLYEKAVDDCAAAYSSSNETMAITGSGYEDSLNIWEVPPPAS